MCHSSTRAPWYCDKNWLVLAEIVPDILVAQYNRCSSVICVMIGGDFVILTEPGQSVISPQLSTIHIFHTKLIMDINPSRTQHSEPLNHLLLGMGTHNFQPYLFKSCSLMPFTSQSLCPPGSLHNEKIFRTMQTFFLEAKIHGFVEV